MSRHLEPGLDTFGDVTADATGRLLSHAQVIRNVVEEAVLADGLGPLSHPRSRAARPILRQALNGLLTESPLNCSTVLPDFGSTV